jgi:hypothetical protein
MHPGYRTACSSAGRDKAGTRVGDRVSVSGRVAGTYFDRSDPGSPTFLDLGHNYPNSHRFTVVIWGENRSAFNGRPEWTYKGENVVVTGKVTRYQGIQQIEVSDPGDIQKC